MKEITNKTYRLCSIVYLDNQLTYLLNKDNKTAKVIGYRHDMTDNHYEILKDIIIPDNIDVEGEIYKINKLCEDFISINKYTKSIKFNKHITNVDIIKLSKYWYRLEKIIIDNRIIKFDSYIESEYRNIILTKDKLMLLVFDLDKIDPNYYKAILIYYNYDYINKSNNDTIIIPEYIETGYEKLKIIDVDKKFFDSCGKCSIKHIIIEPHKEFCITDFDNCKDLIDISYTNDRMSYDINIVRKYGNSGLKYITPYNQRECIKYDISKSKSIGETPTHFGRITDLVLESINNKELN